MAETDIFIPDTFWDGKAKEAQQNFVEVGEKLVEVGEKLKSLPPGIWDAPQPDDMDAYRQFVEIYNAVENDLPVPTVQALGGYYNNACNWCESPSCTADDPCPTVADSSGSGQEVGHYASVSIDATSDDGILFLSKSSTSEDGTNWSESCNIGVVDTTPVLGLSYSSDGTSSTSLQVNQTWLCFRNVQVDPNAVINKALLSITVSGSATGDITAGVSSRCQLPADNPATLDGTAMYCCWRKFSSENGITIPQDTTNGTTIISGDIGDLIHKMTSLTNWNSGDDLLLLLEGPDSALFTDGSGDDIQWNIETAGGTPAQLEIWWEHQGVLCGGSAVITTFVSEEGTGGVLVGGQARTPIFETASGGVVAGGEAVITKVVSDVASGGVVLGGEALSWTEVEAGQGAVLAGGSAVVSSSTSVVGTGGAVISQPRLSNGYLYRTTLTIPAEHLSADLQSFYVGCIVDVPLEGDVLVTDTAGNVLDHEVRDSDGGIYWLFFRANLSSTVNNEFWIFSGGAA